MACYLAVENRWLLIANFRTVNFEWRGSVYGTTVAFSTLTYATKLQHQRKRNFCTAPIFDKTNTVKKNLGIL